MTSDSQVKILEVSKHGWCDDLSYGKLLPQWSLQWSKCLGLWFPNWVCGSSRPQEHPLSYLSRRVWEQRELPGLWSRTWGRRQWRIISPQSLAVSMGKLGQDGLGREKKNKIHPPTHYLWESMHIYWHKQHAPASRLQLRMWVEQESCPTCLEFPAPAAEGEGLFPSHACSMESPAVVGLHRASRSGMGGPDSFWQRCSDTGKGFICHKLLIWLFLLWLHAEITWTNLRPREVILKCELNEGARSGVCFLCMYAANVLLDFYPPWHTLLPTQSRLVQKRTAYPRH